MKVIKNILLGLGALFLLIVVFFTFLWGESSDFKEQNALFINNYLETFSTNWDLDDVKDQMTNGLLIEINTPNGTNAMNYFKTLGRLQEIRDLEINNYNTTLSGKTGVFLFKAKFQYSDTVVKMILQKNEDGVKVNGLYITPLGKVNDNKEIPA